MKPFRIALLVIGILSVLIGIVWFFQGINVLAGSMMSGKTQWSINGGIAFAAGIILILGSTLGRSKVKK